MVGTTVAYNLAFSSIFGIFRENRVPNQKESDKKNFSLDNHVRQFYVSYVDNLKPETPEKRVKVCCDGRRSSSSRWSSGG